MNSSFLKCNLTVMSLVIFAFMQSSAASSGSSKINFVGEKVLLSQGSSLTQATSIHIALDYQNRTVSIFAPRAMPKCPEGMACVQMMPAPYRITLPIQKISEDSCGIKKVIAAVDQRPVDGILTKVSLEDATQTSCMFFRAPDQRFQMLEKYFNRQTGKEISHRARLNLQLDLTGDDSVLE